MVLKKNDGSIIKTVEEWEKPKKNTQWKDGRSAKELAKSWFSDDTASVPVEISEILKQKFGNNVEILQTIPEFTTNLPEKGEGRNHDLYCQCNINNENVTLCIEGKVDEPFDAPIIEKYKKALEKRNNNKNTRLPERIEKLVKMLPLQYSSIENSIIKNNGYQLLTALTGTAIQAKKDNSDFAIFLIHEFYTKLANSKKINNNQKDYSSFVKALSNENNLDTNQNILFGPIKINHINCYMGKVVSNKFRNF